MMPAGAKQIASRLCAWFEKNARDLPWRRDASPYRVWVSEIMLQQTKVATVIPYFERFIARFPNVRALAAADEQDVLALWSGLGYYRRARMLHQAAHEIVARHGCELPSNREALLELPGIGPYTAGAILSIAFNQPEPIVDGNVERVFARMAREQRTVKSTPAQAAAWSWARSLVQSKGAMPRVLNQALMELGATLCMRILPSCNICPVAKFCEAKAHGDAARFPRVAKKAAPRLKRYIAWLVQDKRGRVLLVRRSANQPSLLPDGLWELPHAELKEARGARRSGRATQKVIVRQTIMNWKVELVVKAAKPHPKPRGTDACWFDSRETASLPMASITRKALKAALG